MLPILNQSLWRDEAFSALISQKGSKDIIILTAKDTTPPLHSLLLHFWMLAFGQSEVSIRGLSFLFHVLTVCVVFFLCKKFVKSPLVSSLIALTTLLNPFLLQYAFEGRTYSLLAFLTVLSVYLLILRRYLLASVALSLAVFSHNFSLFTLFSIMCWFVYIHRKKLLAVKKQAILLFTFPVVSILVWGTVLWNQWTKVASGFWIKPATFSLFLHSFEKYSQGDLTFPLQPMVFTFTIIVCFFAFSYWIKREQKEEQGDHILLLSCAILIPTLITYLLSALFTPIYDERYLIGTVPLLISLIGYSLWRVSSISTAVKTLVIAFTAVYIMLLVQSSEIIVSQPTKAPINYAVRQILMRARPGDVIIPEEITNFLEAKWYVKQSGRTIPVFAYAKDGEIPFYIGGVLYLPQEVVTKLPKGVRIWQITPDGGYHVVH